MLAFVRQLPIRKGCLIWLPEAVGETPQEKRNEVKQPRLWCQGTSAEQEGILWPALGLSSSQQCKTGLLQDVSTHILALGKQYPLAVSPVFYCFCVSHSTSNLATHMCAKENNPFDARMPPCQTEIRLCRLIAGLAIVVLRKSGSWIAKLHWESRKRS